MKPTDHRVLITGGATGIGFALASKFHAFGNHVILVGRSGEALARATAALPGAEACVSDLTRADHRSQLVERYGDISILVNNAGVQVNGTIAGSSPTEIENELGINLVAPVLLARAYVPRLVTAPSAAIVNVSSALALVPKENAAVYCASKAGLRSFSRALRWQLEGTNVRVFELVPPLVDTAMTAGRGTSKMSPARLADEFWRGFTSDRHEIVVGKARLLSLVNRLAPSLAERIMRRGG